MTKFAQKCRQYGSKLAVVALPLTASGFAAAEGISDVSTTITSEIADVVPVVTSIGMALLSVYVVVKAFRLVSGFLGGR